MLKLKQFRHYMAESKSLLGSFYPTCETFQTEFKEFWLKYSPTLTMDKEAIKDVIYSGLGVV